MILFSSYNLKKYSFFILATIFFASTLNCAPLEYTIQLPVLGDALLVGTIDIMKSEFSFAGSLVSKAVSLELGPLTLDKPTILLSNTKGLGLIARGTLLNNSVEAGIKEVYSKDKIVLGLTFLTKPTIKLGPTQSVTLDSIDVILEKDKPVKLQTTITAFSQQILLTIAGSKEETYFECDVPLLKITDFDSNLASTMFKDIAFKKCVFKIGQKKLKDSSLKKQIVEISGGVDLQSLPMDTISADLSQLHMSAYYSADDGLSFATQSNKELKFEPVGSLKKASFVFFSKPQLKSPSVEEIETKKPSEWSMYNQTDEQKKEDATSKLPRYNLFLSGETDLTIPTLGTLSIAVNSHFTKNSFDFEGSLKNPIEIGPLKLINPSIAFSSNNFSFTLDGTSSIEDLLINTHVVIAFKKDKSTTANKQQTKTPSLNKSQCDITIEGSVKSDAPYYPFKNLTIPGIPSNDIAFLKTIALENITVHFEQAALDPTSTLKRSLYLDGTISLWKNPIEARVLFGQSQNGDKGVSMRIGLPQGWKFSNMDPHLEPLDHIPLQNAHLFFSTFDYKDQPDSKKSDTTKSMIAISKGISIYGELDIEKLLTNRDKYMQKEGSSTLSFAGSLSTSGQFKLAATVMTPVKFNSSKVKSINGSLVIGSPVNKSSLPYIALELSLIIKPTEKDEELTFTAQIMPTVEELKISGTLQGTWNAPLGIHGVYIGDIALEADINYAQLAAGIPLSGLGFAGNLQLGSGDKKRAMKVAFHITENINDMFIAGTYDRALSFFELIDIIKDITARAIDETVQNSNQSNEQKAKIKKQLDDVIAKDISKDIVGLYLHDLSIYLVPQTSKIGTLQFEQGISLKGKLEMWGKTAAVDINISSSGVHAEGTLPSINWGPFFKLTGTSLNKKYKQGDGPFLSLDLSVEKQGLLISGLLTFFGIERQIQFSLDKEGLYTEFTQKLFNLFEFDLTLRSQGSLKNPDLMVEGKCKQDLIQFLNIHATQEINTKIKEAVDSMQKPLAQVQGLSKQLQDVDDQINWRKNRIQELSRTPLDGFKNAGEIIKLSAEITGLGFERGGITVGKEVGAQTLKSSQDFLNGIGQVAKQFTTLPAKVLDIQSVTLRSSIQELGKGELPLFSVDVAFLGKLHHLKLQLDLSSSENAQKSSQNIALQLIELFHP